MQKANTEATLATHKDTHAAAFAELKEWLPMWQSLNEAFYPIRFASLYGSTSLTGAALRNTKMIDGEPANALLVLAAGFMNGVTSPARKWFKLKRPGNEAYQSGDKAQSAAHTETQKLILSALAGSNYYDTRAVQVYDAAGLGTGLTLCYEDRDTIVKFINCPVGTYAFTTDEANIVRSISRTIKLKATDLLAEFGEEALPSSILERARKGGAQGRTTYLVHHIIEENARDNLLSARTPFREAYWLAAPQSGAPPYLAVRPLYEWPASILRWDCPEGVTYGVPPTLRAIGKAVQLQNLEYKSDQGLDKMIAPPLLASMQLKNRPKAFSAHGITYTTDLSSGAGARPVYQVQVPFQELELKRERIVQSIREALHNHLFNQFTQLETVRSATEIDARQEERLVLMGPVLHRSYGEDLSPAVRRVHGIMSRKRLLPPIPEGDGAELEFSNILSDVQKASDVTTIERFFAFTGSIIPVFPEIQQKVDAFDLLKQYAEGIGVAPSALKPDEVAAEALSEQGEMGQLAQSAAIAKDFAGAAQGLGQVDVGGGLNAVQALMGG